MRSKITKAEILLLLACLGLLMPALFAPPVAPPLQYHQFADQRMLWGLPFAMDVLSNAAFALAGIAGGAALALLPSRSLSNVQRAMAVLFFTGLMLTAGASSWYHGYPDEAGLAIDRCGMAFAFAGLLGLAAAGRVSERAGAALGLAALAVGPYCAHVAFARSNVLPWALLQFGGMALVIWLAALRRRHGALDIRWGVVIMAYAVAKLLELNDRAVYQLTGQLVSGHTLKHVVAALAAWPVIAAIRALGRSQRPMPGRIRIGRASICRDKT
ncbi:MAG TPA: hypothetical protein VKP68_10365 [Ramlibacter sp.]|nr:hypothetical protein [Ramlibacter sp.]